MCSVDVRDEMNTWPLLAVRLNATGKRTWQPTRRGQFTYFQSLRDHQRAEIRTANADVHHVRDGLAGVAFPLATANGVRERLHLLQDAMDVRENILPVDEHLLAIFWSTQGCVKNSASFSEVDRFAAEHLRSLVLDPALAAQGEQLAQNVVVDEILRVVEQNQPVRRWNLQGVLGKAFLVIGEQLPKIEIDARGVVELLQVLPRFLLG